MVGQNFVRRGWLLAACVLLSNFAVAHAEPNAPADVVLRLSERLATPLLRSSFESQSKIERMLFDAEVLGWAKTSGELALAFEEGGGHAALSLTLRGCTTTRTLSHLGPARLYSVRTTPFTATKQIVFDGRRLSHQPAQVKIQPGVVEEQVFCTLPGLRGQIVRSVAERQVARLRPQADQIAQADVETSVSTNFNRRVEEALGRVNRALLLHRVVRGLLGRPAPQQLRFSTTAEHLQIELAFAGPASPTPPLAALAERDGVLVELWVHRDRLGDEWAERLAGWRGLAALVAERYPMAERPWVQGVCWLLEQAVQLDIARVEQQWLVVRAGPLVWEPLAAALAVDSGEMPR